MQASPRPPSAANAHRPSAVCKAYENKRVDNEVCFIPVLSYVERFF